VYKRQDAYKVLIRSKLTLKEAVEILSDQYPQSAEVQTMIRFALESEVGLARPRKRNLPS
jgi:acyl-[acyl carrier protein]--UDP-N-acetylglucosamine O-acyltransferase